MVIKIILQFSLVLLADRPHQFKNNYFLHPFKNTFFSRLSVQPHPFKNFHQQFICSTASVQKFLSAMYPFDCICAKIFFICATIWLHPCKNFLHPCICSAIPFRMAWLSISHPHACCALACPAFIPKECFHVRGHICAYTEATLLLYRFCFVCLFSVLIWRQFQVLGRVISQRYFALQVWEAYFLVCLVPSWSFTRNWSGF